MSSNGLDLRKPPQEKGLLRELAEDIRGWVLAILIVFVLAFLVKSCEDYFVKQHRKRGLGVSGLVKEFAPLLSGNSLDNGSIRYPVVEAIVDAELNLIVTRTKRSHTEGWEYQLGDIGIYRSLVVAIDKTSRSSQYSERATGGKKTFTLFGRDVSVINLKDKRLTARQIFQPGRLPSSLTEKFVNGASRGSEEIGEVNRAVDASVDSWIQGLRVEN